MGLDAVISEHPPDPTVESVESRRPLWGLHVWILSQPLAHLAPVPGPVLLASRSVLLRSSWLFSCFNLSPFCLFKK